MLVKPLSDLLVTAGRCARSSPLQCIVSCRDCTASTLLCIGHVKGAENCGWQVLCGFILLFISITAFSLKRFNFQQR